MRGGGGEDRSQRCPSLAGGGWAAQEPSMISSEWGRCVVWAGRRVRGVSFYIYRLANTSNNKPFIYTSVISLDHSNHS